MSRSEKKEKEKEDKPRSLAAFKVCLYYLKYMWMFNVLCYTFLKCACVQIYVLFNVFRSWKIWSAGPRSRIGRRTVYELHLLSLGVELMTGRLPKLLMQPLLYLRGRSGSCFIVFFTFFFLFFYSVYKKKIYICFWDFFICVYVNLNIVPLLGNFLHIVQHFHRPQGETTCSKSLLLHQRKMRRAPRWALTHSPNFNNDVKKSLF